MDASFLVKNLKIWKHEYLLQIYNALDKHLQTLWIKPNFIEAEKVGLYFDWRHDVEVCQSILQDLQQSHQLRRIVEYYIGSDQKGQR